MPAKVFKARLGAARIRHALKRVIVPVEISTGALLRCGLMPQPPVTVVFKSARLSGLVDRLNLIEHVVTVGGCGIDRLRIGQLFHLPKPTQRVHCHPSSSTGLIAHRDNLASRASTTAVAIFARCVVGVSCEQGATLPVIGLRTKEPGAVVSCWIPRAIRSGGSRCV